MPVTYPKTHYAVVTPGKRQPLAIKQVATAEPGLGEVVVHVQWTSSSPLNLHQADGGLLTNPQDILGDTFVGVVVASGPEDPAASQPFSSPIRVGDHVMGFAGNNQQFAGFQTYVTAPRHLMGRIPSNISMEQAATVPSSLVTAMHTIATELQLELPWPRLSDWAPKAAGEPFLVWGAASSVGLFAVQVLHYWGYGNVIAVASRQHHEQLTRYGATKCFDYKDEDVTDQIKAYAPHIPHIIDGVGSLEGTLRPLSKVAGKGTKVAIMMPVIVRDATGEHEPDLAMDLVSLLGGLFVKGVELIGVRTFFYEKVYTFPEHQIFYSLLE